MSELNDEQLRIRGERHNAQLELSAALNEESKAEQKVREASKKFWDLDNEWRASFSE